MKGIFNQKDIEIVKIILSNNKEIKKLFDIGNFGYNLSKIRSFNFN